MKTVEILRAFGGYARNERFGRDAFSFGLEHDWCAVRVVRADEMHFVPLHPLKPHPDIGLDVLHDVADMERAVGVRQSGGNEDFAGHGGALCEERSIVTNPSRLTGFTDKSRAFAL